VIIKAEALTKGNNIRFVVTSRSDEPSTLYHWYTNAATSPNGAARISRRTASPTG
jgi:hypothetical protein